MDRKQVRELLNQFFVEEDFFKGVILHTIAVITSAGNQDWWGVDIFPEGHTLLHHPTVMDKGRGWIHYFQMISQTELDILKWEAGTDDIDALVARLKDHPNFLTDTKRLMREQLP